MAFTKNIQRKIAKNKVENTPCLYLVFYNLLIINKLYFLYREIKITKITLIRGSFTSTKKGQEIFDVAKQISDLIPDDNERPQHVKKQMLTDAMTLTVNRES